MHACLPVTAACHCSTTCARTHLCVCVCMGACERGRMYARGMAVCMHAYVHGATWHDATAAHLQPHACVRERLEEGRTGYVCMHVHVCACMETAPCHWSTHCIAALLQCHCRSQGRMHASVAGRDRDMHGACIRATKHLEQTRRGAYRQNRTCRNRYGVAEQSRSLVSSSRSAAPWPACGRLGRLGRLGRRHVKRPPFPPPHHHPPTRPWGAAPVPAGC
jgi:hypothetical protein